MGNPLSQAGLPVMCGISMQEFVSQLGRLEDRSHIETFQTLMQKIYKAHSDYRKLKAQNLNVHSNENGCVFFPTPISC